ncbi:hypothetical protein AURDEDRAFT_112788 [Auricularia subglabra TFB-10046 SS5]|nr:hypothetical protein AURDEDRAFT_112788 [Auricularia subglabra TFB-10046 SS5]
MMQPLGNLWATIRILNGPGTNYPKCVNDVDFGDIAGSHGQFVWPWHKCGIPEDYEVELPMDIRTALSKTNLDPVDVHNYWLAKECMYVWVRPDKFPVREAFTEPLQLLSCDIRSEPSNLAALPWDILFLISQYLSLRDILALLALCTSLRARLADSIDSLAKQRLTWAVPLASGEQDRWDASLALVDASAWSPCFSFPWLSYARQCERSPSMRNRQRIWGICQQYERLAISHGVL